MAMRKALLILLAAAAATGVAAEPASWYTATEPGYLTESGTMFDDSIKGAACDTLALGTVAELYNPATGRSTVLTVIDRLPELPEGRTIAVTEAAAEELGMLGTGLADVVVSVVREGSIERKASTNTGWYSFDLGLYTDMDDLMLRYGRLKENGLMPFISIEEGGVRLSVKHVMAYQLKNASDMIALAGIDPSEPEPEPNPYS